MKPKHFKIKKRFLALTAAIVLIAAVTAGYVLLNGSHYDYETHLYTDAVTFDVESVVFEPEGVVRYTGFYIKDEPLGKHPVLTFESVGEGDTTVSFQATRQFSESDEAAPYISDDISLHVTRLGIIVNNNSGSFNGFRLLIFQLIVLFIVIFAIMGFSYVEAVIKAQFGYSMIAYGGLAIFFGALSVYFLYDFYWHDYFSLHDFINNVMLEKDLLFFMMIPLLLLLSVLVSISNLWLIRHEGMRPVNLLGIAISVVWFAGTCLTLYIYVTGVPYNTQNLGFENVVRIILTYTILYFECMILSSAVSAFLASVYKPRHNKDYIIILGCAIRRDGSLTPLLRGRVDKAIAFEAKQFAETGKHASFVPSGGQGADEVISEAEAMKRYLVEQGIPEEQILKEDKSVNTFENMKFSKAVIEAHAGSLEDKNIAFSTTNYHVFRGCVLAKKNGYYAQGLSAKTKPYFFPNAFLREFIGLLYDKKWYHLIFLVLINAGSLLMLFL